MGYSKYKEKIVARGFSRGEGVDLDETLSLVTRGFSQDEAIDCVEVDASVVRGFEVHGKHNHDCKFFTVWARDTKVRDGGVR
jgi:hypothetical protein